MNIVHRLACVAVAALLHSPGTTKLAALTSGELDFAGIQPAHASFVRRDPALEVGKRVVEDDGESAQDVFSYTASDGTASTMSGSKPPSSRASSAVSPTPGMNQVMPVPSKIAL